MVRGELSNEGLSETAATLMTLDALGDAHIDVMLQSVSGSFESALSLLDVIDVLGVPVHARATGLISGGAVGVLAGVARRHITPHARLHLCEPEAAASGRPSELVRFAAEHDARRAQFFSVVAARTGNRRDELERQWAGGVYLDAGAAVAAGYADEVAH